MDQDRQDGLPNDVGASHSAFTASSARRHQRPSRPLGPRIFLWVVGLLIVLVLYFQLLLRPGNPSPVPTPTPTSTPTALPSATPTPGTVEEAGAWVEVTPEPTATPTPLPTLTPRPPRIPTPTPMVEQCVTAQWYAVQNRLPLNRVRVIIEATNGCGRELRPTDVWFEVSGWREGAMVQTVDGHPLEELWPGDTKEVIIGLPGSLDWYDEIRVLVHGPGR